MRLLSAALLPILLAPLAARAAERPVHRFLEVAMAPDGSRLADVEGDAPPGGYDPPIQSLVLRPVRPAGAAVTVTLPCGAVPECSPSSLAWSPDGQHLAFALRVPGQHADDLYEVDPAGAHLTRVLHFAGTLTRLRFGRDGALAVLAVADADKEVGATEAGAPITGALGTTVLEQRIGVLDNGALRWASPPNLFVYQYDWRPDGRGLVGTAAAGDGDNNYWFARLYAFDRATGAARELFRPGPREQLADPVVSPDGREVAFIGGIMSDFGAVGGDLYTLGLTGGGAPVDLTAGAPFSVMSTAWNCHDHALDATILRDGENEVASFGAQPAAHAAPRVLWHGATSLSAGEFSTVSVACGDGTVAAASETWTKPPEIVTDPLGPRPRALTNSNAGETVSLDARSIGWTGDGLHAQGWLLLPAGAPAGGKRRPMVTIVHGGPAWAWMPFFLGAGTGRDLLEHGDALFLPNPRGSFGQGERFTLGNVRDLGGGDFRDIMHGIDAAIRTAPIDGHRLGLTGGSYGGFMTMWAVTQTDRFRAAVAEAGVSDWLSYYGENGIDGWLNPYFGASVYKDPAVYAKSSPIRFITHVHTPTAAYGGEFDIECPPGQTEEFWHALSTLGVPTEAVIYAGEGHGLRDPAHVADQRRRVVAWFDRYLGPG